MDPLRLGFRSIVGITMPGAIVVLSVIYGLWATGLVALPRGGIGNLERNSINAAE